MTDRVRLVALALVVVLCGCVSQATHEEALKDAQSARADLAKEKARADDLAKALAQAEKKGASEETLKELEELRAQKAKVDERLRLFEEFIEKFKTMIDAGRLEIVVRRGRIVLVMSTDVLFDLGKTEIKKEGKAALREIAKTLRTIKGRRFQVMGHTDSTPIRKKEFPSNWELSTARALVVTHYLIRRGVRASYLSAAGYGQHDPIASNGRKAGRAKNRRIEIALVPNIEELIALPVLKKYEAPEVEE